MMYIFDTFPVNLFLARLSTDGRKEINHCTRSINLFFITLAADFKNVDQFIFNLNKKYE